MPRIPPRRRSVARTGIGAQEERPAARGESGPFAATVRDRNRRHLRSRGFSIPHPQGRHSTPVADLDRSRGGAGAAVISQGDGLRYRTTRPEATFAARGQRVSVPSPAVVGGIWPCGRPGRSVRRPLVEPSGRPGGRGERLPSEPDGHRPWSPPLDSTGALGTIPAGWTPERIGCYSSLGLRALRLSLHPFYAGIGSEVRPIPALASVPFDQCHSIVSMPSSSIRTRASWPKFSRSRRLRSQSASLRSA